MKLFIAAIAIFSSALFPGRVALAHGADAADSSEHTAREEAEGKIIWEKLQSKEEKCANLSEGDFGALGEYFMGRTLGASHESMNNMMTRMMGEEGEEQTHAVMGKRLSGCDSAAAYPRSFLFNSIFNPMMGNWGQNMMWGGFGSWLFPLTWMVWLLVGILAAVWLWKQIQKK